MPNIKLYPHDMASEGCKVLASTLDIKRISHKNSRFRGRADKIVINWGSSQCNDEVLKCRVINHPDAVRLCANKLSFFQAIHEIPEEDRVRTPKWTTERDTVLEWLQKGHTVAARQVLNGSGGEGLVLFDGTQQFVEAPLYTMYVKKKEEFRVHIVNGEVVTLQRKAFSITKRQLNTGYDSSRGIYVGNSKEIDHRIRNTANGYIFQRNDIEVPEDVVTQAKKVFQTIPLDFGAVDVIYNNKLDKAFVLEVNTAPGLEGTTINEYATALKGML